MHGENERAEAVDPILMSRTHSVTIQREKKKKKKIKLFDEER